MVVNENAAVPSVLVRVALQFPLTLVELPLPHAHKINNIEQSTAIAKCRISNSFGGKNPFCCGKLLIGGHGEVCNHTSFSLYSRPLGDRGWLQAPNKVSDNCLFTNNVLARSPVKRLVPV